MRGAPYACRLARVGRADVHEQRVVALGLARRGPPGPGVEAAARDAEHATEAPEAELARGGRR